MLLPQVQQPSCVKILSAPFIILMLLLCSLVTAQAQITVTSLSPQSNPVGSNINIFGSGFSLAPVADANVVYFGGVKAKVLSVFSNQLFVTVPAGSFYSPVSVTNTSTNLTAYSPKQYKTTFTNNSNVFTPYSFAAKIDAATGSGTFYVASADFDGDGKADLAVANYTDNTFSVLKNTSADSIISFAAKNNIATGTNPVAVSIADIDGDGKLDLITVNGVSNNVSVFRNTSAAGAISFANKVDITTGNSPYSAAISDFDGDGKPDIATANRGGTNTVSLLRNTSTVGAVSFAAKADIAAGNDPISIAAADLTSDGKPDIALVNYFGSNASVYKNISTPGTISFSSKTDIATGQFPISIAIGDVDIDGKQDIVVANFVDNTVSVLQNFSDQNNFSFQKKDYATAAGPVAIAINDFNGDGYSDIITANQTASSVSILKNIYNGDGLVHIAATVNYPTGDFPTGIFAADMNADGKPDIITANNHGQSVSVLQNREGQTSLTVTPCVGSSATLNANIAGTAYQWQFDGGGGGGFFDISPSDGGFSASKTSSLVINIAYSFFYAWRFRCLTDGQPNNIYTIKYTDSWNGSVSTAWQDAANWNCNVIPDNNTDVIINTGNDVVVGANVSCRSLKIRPGATVKVNPGFNLQISH